MGQFDFTTGITAAETDLLKFPMIQGFKISSGILQVDTSADGFRTIWIPTGRKLQYNTTTGQLKFATD